MSIEKEKGHTEFRFINQWQLLGREIFELKLIELVFTTSSMHKRFGAFLFGFGFNIWYDKPIVWNPDFCSVPPAGITEIAKEMAQQIDNEIMSLAEQYDYPADIQEEEKGLPQEAVICTPLIDYPEKDWYHVSYKPSVLRDEAGVAPKKPRKKATRSKRRRGNKK